VIDASNYVVLTVISELGHCCMLIHSSWWKFP